MLFVVIVELFVRRNGQTLAPFKVPSDKTVLPFSRCKLVGSHGVKSQLIYVYYISPLKSRLISRRRSGVTEACSFCCERTVAVLDGLFIDLLLHVP